MPKKQQTRVPVAGAKTIALLGAAFAAFVAVCGTSMSLYEGLFPRVIEGTYSFAPTMTGSRAFDAFPLAVPDAPRMIFPVTAEISLPRVHAKRYVLSADDCLEGLRVNGADVPLAYPICDYHRQFAVDLGGHVRAGRNVIEARVGNGGGLTRFDLRPSYADPIVFFFPALIAAFWCAVVYASLRLLKIGTTVQQIELVLLALFLLGRAWLLLRTGGWVRGFDVGPHLEMVLRIDPFDWLTVGVAEAFYSYHPPIGFVLAKLLVALSLRPETAAYAVSFAASFGAFLYARAFLKATGFLDRFAGVAFLYVFCSLPAVIFLSSSVNLESLVLFFGVAALYHATLALRPSLGSMPFAHACLCVLALVCGLLTKFNGVIALAVPLACVYFFPPAERTLRAAASAVAVSCVAVVLVAPYYVLRNVAQTGHLFPANTEWVMPRQLEAARAVRDEDPPAFAWKLVSPDWNVFFAPRSGEGAYRNHDYATPRLWDGWKFLWIADRNPLYQSAESVAVSVSYIQAMPWIVLLGSFLWIRRLLRGPPSWERFGVTLFLLAVLNVLALGIFAYNLPYAAFAPIKAIYLPFVMPWVAFAVAGVLPESGRRAFLAVPILLLAGFVFVNHVLIVY